MKSTCASIDPATIREADKVKLIALYGRVCPSDVLANDDPRRDCIASEMLGIGLADSPDSALQVIAWWEPLVENLKPIVASVHRSFRSLKLEGQYGACA